jgi:hypothetical protein
MKMNLDDLIDRPASRTWSPFQEDIFSALIMPDNLLIEAVAGSGKTSTILECMNRIQGKSLFLAFNKAIADDLRSKVRGAEVKTLNGLGHSILTKRLPGIPLETWKTANAVRSKLSTEEYPQIGAQVGRLVGFAKNSAFGIYNTASKKDFMILADGMELDIPYEFLNKACQTAHLVFQEVISDFTHFDFDDQLFMPVFHDWTFPTYDTVFVDEAQDLNSIQHLMLDRLRQKGARIIGVGDTRQAIYGFRGALHNSMEVLKDQFGMIEYPLSITYRCDRSIVALAQSIVPQIVAREGAANGTIEYTDTVNIHALRDGDLVVCRNNAPIFSLAMRALIERRPVRVLSNFVDQLKGFIKSFKTRDLTIFEERLTKWYENEMKSAEESEFFGRQHYLTDKYESVLSLLKEAESLDDMLNALERFGNSRTGPVISTIHKAKGLEAENVTILHREKLPSRYAITEASLIQENNLLYVAITRAKHNLTIHCGE